MEISEFELLSQRMSFPGMGHFVVQCSCARELYTPVSRDQCSADERRSFFMGCDPF